MIASTDPIIARLLTAFGIDPTHTLNFSISGTIGHVLEIEVKQFVIVDGEYQIDETLNEIRTAMKRFRLVELKTANAASDSSANRPKRIESTAPTDAPAV